MLQQRWQQRVNRAEVLSQQQSDRAQAQAAAQDTTITHLRNQLDGLTHTVRTLDDSLGSVKAAKSSLGSDFEGLQLERQQLIAEGQQLRARVQQLEASVDILRQELQQVRTTLPSLIMLLHKIQQRKLLHAEPFHALRNQQCMNGELLDHLSDFVLLSSLSGRYACEWSGELHDWRGWILRLASCTTKPIRKRRRRRKKVVYKHQVRPLLCG